MLQFFLLKSLTIDSSSMISSTLFGIIYPQYWIERKTVEKNFSKYLCIIVDHYYVGKTIGVRMKIVLCPALLEPKCS